MGSPAYQEQSRVPGWWHLLGVTAAGLLGLEVGWSLTVQGWYVVPIVAAMVLVAEGILWRLGSGGVLVVDGVLEARGPDRPVRVPLAAVGAVDVVPTRAANGASLLRRADPRARLAVRTWLPRAVRLEVTAPAPGLEGVPYVLVSSRHPEALAAAIASEHPRLRPGAGDPATQ